MSQSTPFWLDLMLAIGIWMDFPLPQILKS
jgi:hypothetical protein